MPHPMTSQSRAVVCTPMLLTDWRIRLQRRCPSRRRFRVATRPGMFLALAAAGAALVHAGQLILRRP